MTSELGLRERKKQQTRQRIAAVALELFSEKGFDAVTVTMVAKVADVSEGTVFNYFRTKEDLFFGDMQAFEAILLDAVRDRADGESVLTAFSRTVVAGAPRLASKEVADTIASASRIVAGSKALQAREREVMAEYSDTLAELLAEESGAKSGDIEPIVVAAALMSTQRALVAYVRAKVVAGVRGPRLATDFKAQAKRAFGRLERGLGDYGVR